MCLLMDLFKRYSLSLNERALDNHCFFRVQTKRSQAGIKSFVHENTSRRTTTSNIYLNFRMKLLNETNWNEYIRFSIEIFEIKWSVLVYNQHLNPISFHQQSYRMHHIMYYVCIIGISVAFCIKSIILTI